MQNILVIPDVINRADQSMFINFINDNIAAFQSYEDDGNPSRFALRFGVDDVYKTSHKDLSLIPGLHLALKRLFTNIVTHVQEITGDESLYVTSFHMGKQLPGARVDPHIDSDVDFNGHFKYSAVVYLNTITDGDLVFPKFDLSYKPKAGDLVVFPAIGDNWEHRVDTISEDRYNLPIWLTASQQHELKFF